MKPGIGALWLSISVFATGVHADTCPNPLITGDRDIWDASPVMTQTWYRDAFASYFNLQKKHWDQGWGWAKYNDPGPDRFEFGKMMSAGRLLWTGIDDDVIENAELSQGAWLPRSLVLGANSNIDPYPEPSVLSRDTDSVEFVFTRTDGELQHTRFLGDNTNPWFAGQAPPFRTDESISDAVATAKNSYHVSGPARAFSRAPDELIVFARQGSGLLAFHQNGGAWVVENPTTLTVRPTPVNGQSRFLISTEPVVVKGNTDRIHVFAFDNFRHLIHYQSEGGFWWAEDVTDTLNLPETLVGKPVPVVHPNGEIDLFNRTSLGELVLLHRNSSDIWSYEKIERARSGLPVNLRLESDVSATRGPGDSLYLTYRMWFKQYFLVKVPGWNWLRLELTEDFIIESDPTILRMPDGGLHAFSRDWNGALVHAYVIPGVGSDAEVVTAPPNLEGPITARMTSDARIDVFGANSNGHMMHFRWHQPSGWVFENLHFTDSVSPVSDAVDIASIAVTRRGDSAIEIFVPRQSRSSRTMHFSSGLGPGLSPWHGSSEYSEWASGSFQDFRYEPEDATGAFASSFAGFWQTDRVEMKCPSFTGGSPSTRASTMLHESTHIMFWRWRHQANNSGTDCSSPCSDDWFAHTVRDSGASLSDFDKNHSMNQVQIEFLVDIAEFPRGWVPISALNSAMSRANNRIANRILNPPGWVPGAPRPLP